MKMHMAKYPKTWPKGEPLKERDGELCHLFEFVVRLVGVDGAGLVYNCCDDPKLVPLFQIICGLCEYFTDGTRIWSAEWRGDLVRYELSSYVARMPEKSRLLKAIAAFLEAANA